MAALPSRLNRRGAEESDREEFNGISVEGGRDEVKCENKVSGNDAQNLTKLNLMVPDVMKNSSIRASSAFSCHNGGGNGGIAFCSGLKHGALGVTMRA